MDLNGDGHVDILSGSYSRPGREMAGLFQVLRGTKDGGFQPAEALAGSDGEPLIITTGDGEQAWIDKICTRPFAADIDGDGDLDLVAGNFTGTFAFFEGKGDGQFAPTSTWLEGAGGPLRVQAHSDPFLIDWDGDGDLDLLSGSGSGGAFLFTNQGTATAPKWSAQATLVEPHGHGSMMGEEIVFGDAHVTGPQSATRVWVDDVDGDGRLDLLLGDMFTVNHPAKGLDEKTAREKYADWQKRFNEIAQRSGGDLNSDPDFEKLWQEQSEIIDRRMTGSVWLLRQLPAESNQR